MDIVNFVGLFYKKRFDGMRGLRLTVKTLKKSNILNPLPFPSTFSVEVSRG